MNHIHHTVCPVCSSSRINPLFRAKDFSVSNEFFEIWLCADCTLRFTQDPPDESSIGNYYNSPDYISHTDTGKGFINRIYKLVRKYTLNQKAQLVISNTVKHGKLLDVGAGIGAFLNQMQSKGWTIKGIEPHAGARAKANDLFNIQLSEPAVLQQLPNSDFDAITLWHVLEHVHQLHAYIEKLKQLLNSNGKIFIAVPNHQSLDADVYKSYWAAYDVPRHLYHFSPRSMEKLMELHGLKIITKKPMWFDSFYISMLSSGYSSNKVKWVSAFWNGLRSNTKTAFNTDHSSSVIYIIGKK